MRLVSFQLATPLGTQVRTGALDGEGRIVDLALAYQARLQGRGLTARAAERVSGALLPSDMVGLIEGGAASREAAEEALAWAAEYGEERGPDGAALRHQQTEVQLRSPVPRPPLLRDFMAFELHLKNIYPRLGRDIPPEWYNLPVYYKGNPGSVGAHGEAIAFPSYAEELDFEFELAFVIGQGGRNIPRERAHEHIYGFTIYNDFSARAIQTREMTVGLGPAKGKDFGHAHVLGPYLVTADEVGDPYNLAMTARVNGEVWCEANSGSAHWKFADMIAHASLEEELYPGEVFGSGTVGWGSGAERGTMLKRGDLVELDVTGLGTLTNRVV